MPFSTVLAAGPVGGAGTLPGVTTVQQQGVAVATLGAQSLHQGCQVGETPDLAVLSCRILEIEVGEGMRLDATGGNIEVVEKGPG